MAGMILVVMIRLHPLLPLCFLLVFALWPSAASAQVVGKPLKFFQTSTDIRDNQAFAYLRERYDAGDTAEEAQAKGPFALASADLNGDGIDEWVARRISPLAPDPCEARADCLFVVLGLQRREPVTLGTVKASRVEISGDRIYGVRKLMIYNSPDNDYTYKLYSWDPFGGAFTPE